MGGITWQAACSGRSQHGFLLPGQGARPGRAKQRQQVAVNAVVTRHAPRQHQQQRQRPNDRVDADCSGQQEVQVHEHPEEGGDPGQHPQEQTEPNEHLTEGDQVGKDRGVGQHHQL